MRSIFTENAPGPVGVLFLGFTSLAMYRVTQVTGHLRGAAEAAVGTAAHNVLVEYLPASSKQLDADLTASLAAMPDGPAKRQGQAAGPARRLPDRRSVDRQPRRRRPGRTSIVYRKDPAPGIWQPAPGGAMLAPWLGFVRPLILRGPIRAPGVNGPDALTGAAYAADFDEVKGLGSVSRDTQVGPLSSKAARSVICQHGWPEIMILELGWSGGVARWARPGSADHGGRLAQIHKGRLLRLLVWMWGGAASAPGRIACAARRPGRRDPQGQPS